MIVELQRLRGVDVILDVDAEFCDAVVSACELRGEWFEAHGDCIVAERLDAIATIWMVGRRHGRVHSRVAWLALAAGACEWYARVLLKTREDVLARRADHVSRQLHCVIDDYHSLNGCDGKILETE